MMEEGVTQPLLVTISAVTLAAETVRSILKIDDIVRFTSSIILMLIPLNDFNMFWQVNALH